MDTITSLLRKKSLLFLKANISYQAFSYNNTHLFIHVLLLYFQIPTDLPDQLHQTIIRIYTKIPNLAPSVIEQAKDYFNNNIMQRLCMQTTHTTVNI